MKSELPAKIQGHFSDVQITGRVHEPGRMLTVICFPSDNHEGR
ncbi:hypothetical protein F8B43_3916 [Methylorubrum populi]|uniref:Uncharacterized protein n=1 Tax=Methylorubrum populi TaxID=223967 RepID=A0A833J3K1_9HYPH|nr:hypothetical protein F8B43_3916 [Methylorubrum populi]